MIRLLPKSEIDRAKALDRQREIDEGKKLATRVDGLRQTHAKEEAELQSFRSKTLAQIQLEINGEIERLENAKRKVKEKRDELLSLSGPLDKAWLYYVTSEKKQIAEMKSSIEQKSAQLQAKLEQQALLKKDTEQEKRSYVLGQQENVTERSRISQLLSDTEVAASETRNKAAAILVESENQRSEAARKFQTATDRLKAAELYEQRLKSKEDELENREMEVLAKELLYYSPVKKNG